MKKILLMLFALLPASALNAQSLNILNYSGKMYVSKFDVLSTPRYVSFEDHAILSQDMTIPVIEVTRINFDFENNILNLSEKDRKIVSTSLKKYSTDMGWNIVISIKLEGDNDLYELVWQEFGSAYLQEITKEDGAVKICRMHLSTKPAASSPEDELMQLLGGYGL